MPVCDTCKSQIDFLPYREVRIETKSSEIKTMYFHYFFPCWDLTNPNLINNEWKKISYGFTYDEKILDTLLVIRNMERNCDLWI